MRSLFRKDERSCGKLYSSSSVLLFFFFLFNAEKKRRFSEGKKPFKAKREREDENQSSFCRRQPYVPEELFSEEIVRSAVAGGGAYHWTREDPELEIIFHCCAGLALEIQFAYFSWRPLYYFDSHDGQFLRKQTDETLVLIKLVAHALNNIASVAE